MLKYFYLARSGVVGVTAISQLAQLDLQPPPAPDWSSESLPVEEEEGEEEEEVRGASLGAGRRTWATGWRRTLAAAGGARHL